MKRSKKYFFLYPLSILYGLVTVIRNLLFDSGILKSQSFPIPVISVGNLAVGGTGKTPHAEFILSLLQNENKIAFLSRGYKRRTKGFYLANEKSDSLVLGDEPFQIHQKFAKVTVAVDEKRVDGVEKLLKIIPDLQVIVLDDAFQHRYIKPGLSILLTDLANLYTQDIQLPTGKLRECSSGSKRADIIVVTKCPADFGNPDMCEVIKALKPEPDQPVFFSTFIYDEMVPVFSDAAVEAWTCERLRADKAGVLLVAGIVSPQAIVNYLGNYTSTVSTLFFPDHHAFTPKDYILINKMLDELATSDKIIVVTEKDAARLISNPFFPETLKSRTFALPIRVNILNNQEILFTQIIKNYVTENSRNC